MKKIMIIFLFSFAFTIYAEKNMAESKKELIAWIDSIGHSNNTELLIPLDLYFNGNDEKHCIITSNTEAARSAKELYVCLKQIEAKKNVKSIWIRFYSYDDALEFEDSWISSDLIWIVTSASEKDVMSWLKVFEPTEIHKEKYYSNFINRPDVPSGYEMLGVFWD